MAQPRFPCRTLVGAARFFLFRMQQPSCSSSSNSCTNKLLVACTGWWFFSVVAAGERFIRTLRCTYTIIKSLRLQKFATSGRSIRFGFCRHEILSPKSRDLTSSSNPTYLKASCWQSPGGPRFARASQFESSCIFMSKHACECTQCMHLCA